MDSGQHSFVSHAPMSERQQLALIKRLEKQSVTTPTNNTTNGTDNENLLVSPPRTPLQVVNGPSSGGSTGLGAGLAGPSGEMGSGSNNSANTPSAKLVAVKRLSLQGTPKSPIVDRLLKKICKKNGKGETALHTAAIKGSRRLVQTLLQLGADPNAQDNAEWSPIHEACNRGNHSVVRILHEFGADINLKGFAKDSPLHDAARNGHFKVVKFLVRSGADLTAKNAAGRTPREEAELVAIRCANDELARTVSYLIDHESKPVDDDDEGCNGGKCGVITSFSDLSSVESNSEEEEDEEDAGNGDVAKFLGLSKSPSAVNSTRLLEICPSLRTLSTTPTSSKNGRRPGEGERRGESVKVRLDRLVNGALPTSSSDQQKTAAPSPAPSSRIRLTFGMEGAKSADSPRSSSTAAKLEGDVYEFKANAKESMSDPGKADVEDKRSTTSPTSATDKASTGSGGEKRVGAVDSDEEDEVRKKKRKDEAAGRENPSVAVGSVLKGGRSTRGSSCEKSIGSKVGGKTRTATQVGPDRKSPSSSLSGSAASDSPKKPQSRDHSDAENEEEAKRGTESGVGALKVPPLKIVLSSNGTGGSNSQTSSESEGKRAKDCPEGKESGKTFAENNEVSAMPINDPTSDKAAAAAAAGSRVTRSRAIQPGPFDGSKDGSQSQSDGAGSATDSSGGSASAAANDAGSSNAVDRDQRQQVIGSSYDYNLKKRKLRSQVEEGGGAGGGAASGSASFGNGGGSSGAGTSAAQQQPSSGVPKIGNLVDDDAAAASSSSAAAPASAAPASAAAVANSSSSAPEPMSDIEKFLNIRKQVEQRRKNLFPVQPKPPEGFKDYLMNRKTYLLQHNASERLRSMPMIQPPHSLEGPLRQLFKEQEQERYKLRMRHVVEKEKLVLSVEQEILRVHGRAARALANQSLPFSVCTILRDEEIYTPIDPDLEEKNRDIRSRYNGRLFLSWLQDVDDKWEKIKEQMVLRHHNEAESLNAVQKMDWEWKVNEISLGKQHGSSRTAVAQIDDLHIPMVHVSDDFDLADCRQ